MHEDQARLPLPFTAVSVLTAGCAAIGMTHLVSLPPIPNLTVVLVPVFAVMFSLLLIRAGERVITRTRDAMESSIVRDPQTGLIPPHMADRMLEVEFAAAQRGRPLAIVLFSIDNFGRNAALHGDRAATRWRRAAARVLKQRTRGMNVSARCRGDGIYLTILSDVPLEGACTFAARVRRDYAALLESDDPTAFSAGIASYDPGMRSAADLIARAERALSRAQAEGGKAVMVGPATGGAVRTASEPAEYLPT